MSATDEGAFTRGARWLLASLRIPLIGLALATCSLIGLNGALRWLARREVQASLAFSESGLVALVADVSSAGRLCETAFKDRISRSAEEAPPLPAALGAVVFDLDPPKEADAADVVSAVFSPAFLGPFDRSFVTVLPLEGTAKPSNFSDAILKRFGNVGTLDADGGAATARYLDAVYRELSGNAFWTFTGHRWINGFVQAWTFWLFFWAAWLLLERWLRNVHHAVEAEPVRRADDRRAEADLARSRLDASTGSLVYLAWAIPSVGFIGTILGIGQALENADRMLVTDVAEQQRAIQQVTGLLGTAFDTTLIGLLLSLVLMLAFYVLRGWEDGAVLQAVKESPTAGGDTAETRFELGQSHRLQAAVLVALVLVLAPVVPVSPVIAVVAAGLAVGLWAGRIWPRQAAQPNTSHGLLLACALALSLLVGACARLR